MLCPKWMLRPLGEVVLLRALRSSLLKMIGKSAHQLFVANSLRLIEKPSFCE
jgi:hypothetical protein